MGNKTATNLVVFVTVVCGVADAIKSTTYAAAVTNLGSESGDPKGAALTKLYKCKSSGNSSNTKGAGLAKL